MFGVFFKYLTVIPLLSFLLTSCGKKENIAKYTVEYKEPYYAVPIVHEKLVYVLPDEDSKIAYKIKLHKIVILDESVSLSNPKAIWYHIKESDLKGYVRPDGFRIFEHLGDAEEFVRKSYPDNKVLSAFFPLYKTAYNSFQNKNIQDAILKLHRFIYTTKKTKESVSALEYTTMILIGKLYIKNKEYQKAQAHFDELLTIAKDSVILIGPKDFAPSEIQFYIKEYDNYIRGKTYIKNVSSLKTWDIPLYKAYINEKLKKFQKAKSLYYKLIKKYDVSMQELTYINFIIDRLSELESIDKLEKLKNEIAYKTTHRYILYKLASLTLDKRGYNKTTEEYYKLFINRFEKKYKKSPYKEEIRHYLKARELLKK